MAKSDFQNEAGKLRWQIQQSEIILKKSRIMIEDLDAQILESVTALEDAKRDRIERQNGQGGI